MNSSPHSTDPSPPRVQPLTAKRLRTDGIFLHSLPLDICASVARAYVDSLLSVHYPFDCIEPFLSFAGISSKYKAAIQAAMPSDLWIEIEWKPTNLTELLPLVRMNLRKLRIVDDDDLAFRSSVTARTANSLSEPQLSLQCAIKFLTSSPNLRQVHVPHGPSIVKALQHCKQLEVITMDGVPTEEESLLLWCDTLARLNIEQLNICCSHSECSLISECRSAFTLTIFFDMLDERNICQGLKQLHVTCNRGNLEHFYSTLSFPHLECLTLSSDVPVDTVTKRTSLKSVRLEGRAANLSLANGLGSLVSEFYSLHSIEDFEMLLPCTALSELDVITSPFAIQNFPRGLTTLRELRLRSASSRNIRFEMPPNTMLGIFRRNSDLTSFYLQHIPLDTAEVIRILQIPGRCLETFIIGAELPDDITWENVAEIFNAAAANNPQLRCLDFGLGTSLFCSGRRDGPLLRNQDGSFSDCGPAVRQALMKLKRRAPEFEDDYDSLL